MIELHLISLGAGVQSSTMALMAAHGEITPMPYAAIFADTKAEPASVYRWLEWLVEQLPFPVIRVTYQNGLTKAMEASKTRGVLTGSPPWFTKGKEGLATPVRRACTNDYKVHPIQKKVRELSGAKRGDKNKAFLWIGISRDEAHRMKPSRYPHYSNIWPLIDKRMTRRDCLVWMTKNGYPEPPKSSCVYCPYHSDNHWRGIRDNDPDGWKEAIRVDHLIRDGQRRNGKAPMFAHRSLVPLDEVDLSTDFDRGQMNLFGNECEGMCGV